jgi:hypothetical protein
MSSKSTSLFIVAALFTYACGSSSDDESKAPAAALVVEAIKFDLVGERLLSDLNDEEIQTACEEMAGIMRSADEGVACQIAAASSSESEGDCESERDTCLDAPTEALGWTGVSTSPAPIDCSKFEAALTTDCDYPVSTLEDCVNAMAQSVVPSAEAVSCSNAADIADLNGANEAATNAVNTDYINICLDLLACESLVGALLGGEMDPGAGGAGGSSN